MPAINNLKGLGSKKTDGKIIYQENLTQGLMLIITYYKKTLDNLKIVYIIDI